MARKVIERNISYDKNKERYYAILYFGEENGKKIRKMITCKNIKEARTILRDHEKKMDEGTATKPEVLTLSDWLHYWINNIVRDNIQPTTRYAYNSVIKNHINPGIGNIPLQKLSPTDIQEYYSSIAKKGISNNTIKKHHDILRTALKFAVFQGKIVLNPLSRVQPPKVRKTPISFYSIEQINQLLTIVENTKLELPVKLGLFLGLRKEEILGIKWDNLDLDKKLLRITQVRTAAGGKVYEKIPKTIGSERVISIPDIIADAFKKERISQLQNKLKAGNLYLSEDYVICNEVGVPLNPVRVSDWLYSLVKKNNLPHITMHGLRHTFATIAHQSGIPIADISKTLGHESPVTTSKIYTHVFDMMGKKTIDAVESAILLNQVK